MEKSDGRQPLVRFYQIVNGDRVPRRADRSVGGTLPVRALRYCEPVSSASTFGWHVFLPRRFSLLWDGSEVLWRCAEMDTWMPLRSVIYPGFDEEFDAMAPADVRGFAPPFLSASVQAGMVQIWPGCIARTAPGWSLLVRAVANYPRPSAYELFEGIIETDTWFGPLFTNVRLTRIGIPIEFDDDVPFMQVQPLKKGHYEEKALADFEVVPGLECLDDEAWTWYRTTVVKPNSTTHRKPGAYAASVRKAQAQREVT